jgi:hypothetical protein
MWRTVLGLGRGICLAGGPLPIQHQRLSDIAGKTDGVGALVSSWFTSLTAACSLRSAARGFHVFHLGISGENRDVARIFRQSILVYLGCSLPLWLFSGWLIPTIFGRDFIVDGRAICILLVSASFSILADSLAEYLNGRRKMTADAWGRMVYLSAMFIFGVWMVPMHGLVGMALAMTAGDALRCGYLVARVSRVTGKSIVEFWRVEMYDISDLLLSGKKVFQGLII